MRERIAAAISKELHNNPQSKLLQRQLTLLINQALQLFTPFALRLLEAIFI